MVITLRIVINTRDLSEVKYICCKPTNQPTKPTNQPNEPNQPNQPTNQPTNQPHRLMKIVRQYFFKWKIIHLEFSVFDQILFLQRIV